MAADLELSASRRTVTGKHVHALRREGLIPAILYGHNVHPVALSIDGRRLQKVWHRAGHSHLVDLLLDGGRPRKVLIRELQVNPRTARFQHVDLFAVNLREKLTADVPVVIVGESPAVVDAKIGTLQQLITSLRIECLPSDLPSQFNVDVSGLTEIDAGIHVRDIVLPEGVALVHIDVDELVVKVSALRLVTEEEVEAAEAAEAAEGGEAAAEGEQPAE